MQYKSSHSLGNRPSQDGESLNFNSGANCGVATKVCLASLSFYPLYAGPAVRFQNYAPGFRSRGIHPSVFTQAVTSELLARDGSLDTLENTGPVSDGHWPSFESVRGLPVQRVRLPSGWRNRMTYFHALENYCHHQSINVVQFLHLEPWAIPTLLKLRRSGIGTVFTLTLLSDLSSHRWKRLLQRQHRRLPLNCVDCLVVSSTVMRDQIQDLGLSVPIRIIPNGVNLKRFRPIESIGSRDTLRQELGLGPYQSVIVAIGPVTPRKGSDLLVDAFIALAREFPRAAMVLVGPRHDLVRQNLKDFRDRMQRAIAHAGIADRILFTGPVHRVEDYLRAADILVFPSRREGMPNVVPEAMACGLPVVMTPFLGLPKEFGEPGKQYLLSNGNSQALAGRIKTLLRQPSLSHRLGTAARKWVQENLDLEHSLAEYAELYRSVQRPMRRLDN